MKYLELGIKLFFALPLIIFGANKFLLFANTPPPEGETALMFIGTMFSTYLAKLVGIIEMLGGVLLLIPRTSFIGLLMLLPITVNIVGFHIAHDMPGNGIWLITLLGQILVIYLFKDRFKSLLG